MNSFTIPHELMDLNKFIYSQRANKYQGSQAKRDNTNLCTMYIKRAIADGLTIDSLPINLTFDWYAKNRRKDPDNIAFGKKFILDAMQESGLIENDGFKSIWGFTDNFYIDKDNPRVEVRIESKG